MRSLAVVVVDVDAEHAFEVTRVSDEQPIEALATGGANESLGECVRSWRSNGRLDDSDALDTEHLVETGCELRVSVPDEELDWARSSCEVEGQVAGLLGHRHCCIERNPSEAPCDSCADSRSTRLAK